jgi:hypothetical protein
MDLENKVDNTPIESTEQPVTGGDIQQPGEAAGLAQAGVEVSVSEPSETAKTDTETVNEQQEVPCPEQVPEKLIEEQEEQIKQEVKLEEFFDAPAFIVDNDSKPPVEASISQASSSVIEVPQVNKL